jgi:hypothetical protein
VLCTDRWPSVTARASVPRPPAFPRDMCWRLLCPFLSVCLCVRARVCLLITCTINKPVPTPVLHTLTLRLCLCLISLWYSLSGCRPPRSLSLSRVQMIIPVRCFTCGKVVGNKWEQYLALLQADYNEKSVHSTALPPARCVPAR